MAGSLARRWCPCLSACINRKFWRMEASNSSSSIVCLSEIYMILTFIFICVFLGANDLYRILYLRANSQLSLSLFSLSHTHTTYIHTQLTHITHTVYTGSIVLVLPFYFCFLLFVHSIYKRCKISKRILRICKW